MRIAIIGHIVPLAPRIVPSPMESWGFRYTRVSHADGTMVDHIAHLKDELHKPREEDFSVWEMAPGASLVLQSVLRRRGHEVLVVNYIDADNEDRQFARIADFAPAIVALSTTFILSPSQLNAVCRIVRKHLPDAFVVAGGQHVATELAQMPRERRAAYLKATKLDAFIQDGQGESSLVRLGECFPERLSEVANLIWRKSDGTAVENPRVVETNDISVPVDLGQIEPGSVVHLRTARGCAFKCAFCSYPTSGGCHEVMDLEAAWRMVEQASNKGVHSVIFTDDTFNVPKARFEAFLRGLEGRGLAVPWYSFLRCQYVDEALVDLMRRTGCRGVLLGIESADPTVLGNMNKRAHPEDYRQGIAWLRDRGITTVGAFILGFPGETKAGAARTADFIASSGLDFFYLQLFYYLHNAPVHDKAAEYGLSGKGLLWSHASMGWQEASRLIDELYVDYGQRCLHQDYNLWEVAFLRSKGFDDTAIRQYRGRIHGLTVRQMRESSGGSDTRGPSG